MSGQTRKTSTIANRGTGKTKFHKNNTELTRGHFSSHHLTKKSIFGVPFSRKKRAVTKHGKGFTLIELLVVTSLMSMLASIVLVGVQSARERAYDVKRVTDIQAIQKALELYRQDNGHYPTVPDAGRPYSNCNRIGTPPAVLPPPYLYPYLGGRLDIVTDQLKPYLNGTIKSPYETKDCIGSYAYIPMEYLGPPNTSSKFTDGARCIRGPRSGSYALLAWMQRSDNYQASHDGGPYDNIYEVYGDVVSILPRGNGPGEDSCVN